MRDRNEISLRIDPHGPVVNTDIGVDLVVSTDAKLVCPNCGNGDELASIEQLQGTCRGAFEVVGDAIQFFGDGYTDIEWDTSTTIGWMCKNCWREGHVLTDLIPDYEWAEREEAKEKALEDADEEVGHA